MPFRPCGDPNCSSPTQGRPEPSQHPAIPTTATETQQSAHAQSHICAAEPWHIPSQSMVSNPTAHHVAQARPTSRRRPASTIHCSACCHRAAAPGSTTADPDGLETAAGGHAWQQHKITASRGRTCPPASDEGEESHGVTALEVSLLLLDLQVRERTEINRMATPAYRQQINRSLIPVLQHPRPSKFFS